MDHNGPQWFSVDHNGPQWTTMDLNGSLWTTMDLNGPQWFSVDHNGPLYYSDHLPFLPYGKSNSSDVKYCPHSLYIFWISR